MEQEHQSQMEDGPSSRLHSLNKSLNNLADDHESFPDIYRVPKGLRAGNEQYYTPTTISIGPLHAASEVKLKIWALKLLCSHLEVPLDGLIDSLKEIEGAARMCYNADEIRKEYLSIDKFVEMMLLDGCFILALIPMFEKPIVAIDSVFTGRARGPLLYRIQQDLLLLESQLPFFVLEVLYKALWKANQPFNLIQCAVNFFRGILPVPAERLQSRMMEKPPKHLLELVLFTLFPPRPRDEYRAISIDFPLVYPKNMSELALYGIEVKSIESGGSLADVKFSNGVLEIPTLVIVESTTSLFKNLLALEQCQNQKRSSFTSYLFFMDALVDTDKDIDLLLQPGVLKTWLNDKQALVSLLSGLSTNLLYSTEDIAAFQDIFAGLEDYCSSHKLRACLMRNYYASRWDILNSILIFIFTVTQTVFAIVSYNPRK